MWRSLRLRIGTLPLVDRLLPAKPEQEIAGLAVLFDRDWYLAQNPEAPEVQSDPLRHFLKKGGFEGLDPNPLFDCAWYLERNPDVRAAGLNPLVHYAKSGWREGRDPHFLFDTRRFLARHPEIQESGLDPLAFYLTYWKTGIPPPTPVFRSKWYLERYPDVRDAGLEPLCHYLRIGAAEGRSPNPLFDGKWYLDANPDVAKTGDNPLIHYLHHGSAEGRPVNHLIKGRWYVDRVSDAGEEPAEPSWNIDVPAAAVALGTGFDVLGDFSDCEQSSLAGFLSDGALREHAGRLTLAGPGGALPEPAGARATLLASAREGLSAAIAGAAAHGQHLLIVAGGARPAFADVQKLIGVLDADPMIGFVLPRLATAEGVLPLLPPDGVNAIAAYDRGILAHLPELQLAPEVVGPCVIVRAQVLANTPNFPAHFDTMRGALHAMMTWGRRVGYRTAIANHALVPVDARAGGFPELSSRERETLIGFFPDAAVAEARFRALSCHRKEALLGAALSPVATQRNRLLLDCSGLRPFHNGTSECALAMLDGLAQVRPPWQIDILASEEAAAFHRMEQRYPMFNVGSDHAGPYTSAVRLSQPWTMQDIACLHDRALHIHFFIFDTISWDTIYSTLHEVEQAWAFAALHADGFYYDSHFTMQRFNFRFPVAPHARQVVTHLSFRFDEYRTSPDAADRAGRHVLIVGNEHDHKAIDQALALLPGAFPAQQFVAIGSRKVTHPNVRSIKSGLMSDAEIDRLFADARMIVYPSFYEGFGLPIIKGLSYGLDVVARRSALLDEVAANCAPGGRIVPFDGPASLIAVVGRCLAGEAVETLPFGAAIPQGGSPVGWHDVAMRIFDSVVATAREPGSEIHDRREAALRTMAPTKTARTWRERMTT
jgi:glycosyltransferase involved in cell wall biosynthesis